MTVTLEQIVAATRQKVTTGRSSRRTSELERAAAARSPKPFRAALAAATGERAAIIAELKKASPSRGLIRADFDVRRLAKDLEEAGATALSVLTDEEFFQGSLENLDHASACTSLPCLRKDFIVDEHQILEARAYGASAILLIVAALPQKELESLAGRARDYGMDVLCEVHDEDELQRALASPCELIGVNSRNLRTFQVDLETVFRMTEHMPKYITKVAESGISSGGDIARLRRAGYDAFLIGESLMKAQSPGAELRTFLEDARQSREVSGE